MKKRLKNLAGKIGTLYINEGYGTTWNEHIDMMEDTLSIINSVDENTNQKELEILKGLIKEALNLGLNKKDPTLRSYKRNILYDLTNKIKQELENKPYLKYTEEEITDINSWIKSLKIFKMGNNGLNEDIYENSYDLYQGIKNIILCKKSPLYKKIYVNKIVEKLEANESKLPNNIKIENEDYELYQMMKLVKQSPEFDYHNLGILAYTKERNLDYQTNANRVILLLKDK